MKLLNINQRFHKLLHELIRANKKLQSENEVLKKELGRYKMAWNMAENELARITGEKRK